MNFPTTPNDGDTHTLGTQFTFNAAKQQWIGALPVVSSSGGGGGGIAAPSAFATFSFPFYANRAQNDGGSILVTPGNISTPIEEQFVNLSTDNPGVQAAMKSFGSEYGGIEASGSVVIHPSVPRFDTTADYLASNPTFQDYNDGNGAVNGNFYSDVDEVFYFTNDSGATFQTFVPTPSSDGKIKLTTAGKYRLKVKQHIDFTGSTYGAIKGATAVYLDGTIVSIQFWIAEQKLHDAGGGVGPRVENEEFELIIDAGANSELNFGVSKLGVAFESQGQYTITIESLF